MFHKLIIALGALFGFIQTTIIIIMLGICAIMLYEYYSSDKSIGEYEFYLKCAPVEHHDSEQLNE